MAPYGALEEIRFYAMGRVRREAPFVPISANFDKPKCWGHLDGLIYAFPTSVNTLRDTYEEITNTTKTTISCEFEYIFLILGQKYVYMRRGNVFYTRIDHTYQVRRPADNSKAPK